VRRTAALIERDSQLRTLNEVVAGSAQAGGLVLLSGEAGYGKTSLLGVFTEGLDHRYRILTAVCEPVGIPAAFAPLFDLLEEFPDELRRDIRSGKGRPAVYAGMLDLIKNDRIILVFEDVHFADEATLGMIRYLGRRIVSTSSTLILTYRPEELDGVPALRLVVADLGSSATRIDLGALTPSGVEEMVRDFGLDHLKVHTATLGNPFFIEEVTRHPEQSLPPSVGDAVLASVDRLPTGAREVLSLVALSPEGVPLNVVLSHRRDAGSQLDMAVQRKLLVVSPRGQVSCRHDLIRASLLSVLAPTLRRDLHAELLSHLEGRAGDSPDTARLAYHAVGALAADKAAHYSLEAARDASRAGAHRQAAFHYANALDFRSTLDRWQLSLVLLEAAKEHCLVNAFDTASDLARQRLDLGEESVEKAMARAWLSFFESRRNDLPASRGEALAALEVLQQAKPSEELALAHYVVSWVALATGDYPESVDFGNRAIQCARDVGSLFVEVQAATTVGASRLHLGDRDGLAQIEEAARVGVEEEVQEPAARALYHLAAVATRSWRLSEGRTRFETAIEYTSARELDAWYIASMATVAGIDVSAGRWDDADHDLEQVLGQKTCKQTEVETLVIAATLRARRGDPGSAEMIEEALASIGDTDDHDSLLFGCALLMEGAWIGHVELDRARDAYHRLSRSSSLANDPWGRGILGFWARRLDLEPPPGDIPGPARREWEGRLEDSAQAWRERGFPVEAAIVEAMVPDADLTAVFAELEGLGAEGVIRGLRRELQRRGVRKVPRGDRPATRRNPAGLTPRQAEVLGLIVKGHSNAAIARELFISEKTAGHHVAAILTKLNVSSRLQAAAVATSRGWSQLDLEASI
jgi:DNA-binding CsgD family transcriptional regulator/tetratricopeptide (TPR) repeat protein